MSNIAKLNVLITGGIDGLSSALGKAGKGISGFASQVTSIASGMAIYDLAKSAATGVAELVKTSFDGIDVTAKLADSLGVSTEALTGLQYAADLSGVASEELTGALSKMLNTIGEAGAGSETAVKALDRIGLSAEELKGLSPDQAFAKIGDSLNGIQDPGERAAATIDIFGKSGLKLLPLLSEGSDGLAAMQAEAEKLGLTFSRVDAAQVEEANDSLTKVGKLIQGVGQKFAIELAPYVTAAADALVGFATSGTNMGDLVTRAVEMAATGVAYLAHGWLLAKIGVKGFQAGTLEAIGSVLDGVSWLTGKVVDFSNWLGIGMEKPKFLDDLAQGFHQTAAEIAGEMDGLRKQEWPHEKVGKFFDDIRAKAHEAAVETAKQKEGIGGLGDSAAAQHANLEKVTKALGDMQTKLEQVNMTETEKAEIQLKGLGATDEQIKRYDELAKQLSEQEKAHKHLEDVQNAAKQTIEDTMTPQEKLDAQMAKLQEQLDSGALDWEHYQRAVEKAKDEMDRDTKSPDTKGPQLLTAGSREAAQFAMDIEARANKDQSQDKSLDYQKKSTDYLAEIARKIGQDNLEFSVVDFT